MAITETDRALGALIRQHREQHGLSQDAVAELLRHEVEAGVKPSQGLVTSNEAGKRLSWQLVGAYARVLAIPMEKVNAAIGYGEPAEHREPRTWREVIEADPTLSESAKAHLVNQYGLLQLASAQERATKSVANESRKRTGG